MLKQTNSLEGKAEEKKTRRRAIPGGKASLKLVCDWEISLLLSLAGKRPFPSISVELDDFFPKSESLGENLRKS